MKNVFLIKRANDTDRNMFLIHAGDGEIQSYIKLCSNISSFNCWAIRADRFNDFYPKNETLEEIAERYANIIRSIQANGPYNLLGWCTGGTKAYEIARQFESIGAAVNFVGLINTNAPFFTISERNDMVTKYSLLDFTNKERVKFSSISERRLIERWLEKSGLSWSPLPDSKNIWHDFIDNFRSHENLNVLMNTIKNNLPEDRREAIPFLDTIGLEKLIYYLAVMRSDANSQAYYCPDGKINADIYYFSASESPAYNRFRWSKHTKGQVVHMEAEGTHFSILDSDTVNYLAKMLEYCYSNDKPVRVEEK